MKSILNISRTIDIGSRFNNFSLRNEFPRFGWEPTFASWEKPINELAEIFVAKNKINDLVTHLKRKVSRLTGDIDGYYRNAKYFMEMEVFKRADLLHFHVVHEHFLSLRDWVIIGSYKPVIWTWHDPYPMHGHCIHSFDCEGYKAGCKSCPNLSNHFNIYKDRSFENLNERVKAIEKINPAVIVASDWMQDKVSNSVYGEKLRVYKLPFGIRSPKINDLEVALLRQNYNIPRENIVIGFRADSSYYKGLPLIKAALEKVSVDYPYLPLTIITFDEVGHFTQYNQQFQVIELGWISGEKIHNYYSLMDFFLMPSQAESFGLMAVEAMINGAFPLVTHGTALASMLENKYYSLVSQNTCDDYFKLFVKSLFAVNYFRGKRQELIFWAEEKFSSELFLHQLTNIYTKEYARFHNL